MISYSEPEMEYWKYQRCKSSKIFVGRGYSCLTPILISFSQTWKRVGEKLPRTVQRLLFLGSNSTWNDQAQSVPAFPVTAILKATVSPEISVNIFQYTEPQVPVGLEARSVVKRKSYLKTQNFLRTALFWAITQRVVVIPYRRFGTTF